MSDLHLLFLVLVALYGWECLCWLPHGTVALRSWRGRRWRLVRPSTFLGNASGGVVFSQPLPPLGSLITTGQIPVSVSPEGVWGRAPASGSTFWRPLQTGAWISFDDLRDLRAIHKRVVAGSQVLARAPSGTWALRLADLLGQWRKVPPPERSHALREFLRSSLDTEDIQRRWVEFQGRSRALRWLANSLVLFIFALAPAVTWRFGLRNTWPFLLIGLFGLTLATALTFRKLHRHFYPGATEERFTQVLTILLSPATAARACDLVSRPLFEAAHPLAVARCFCVPGDFRSLAAEAWRDLSFPPAGADSECETNASAAARHTRDVLRTEVGAFLGRNQLTPDDLLAPPKANDPSCRAYCPRCLAQFVSPDFSCTDCGVALVKLPNAASKTTN